MSYNEEILEKYLINALYLNPLNFSPLNLVDLVD